MRREKIGKWTTFVVMMLMISSSFVGNMAVTKADEGENPLYNLTFASVPRTPLSEEDFPPYVPPESPGGRIGNDTIQLPLHIETNPESAYVNGHQINHSIDENIKYEGPLGISSLIDGGTTSPPWDDSDSGVEVIAITDFHNEWATDNRYTGFGDLGTTASCGFAAFVITHVWCWFKGHYDCANTGDYYVQFDIDYEGLLVAVDLPSIKYIGVDKLEIISDVYYQIAGEPAGKDLIVFRDSWPVWGDYPVPGPYDEQGPFKIGYDEPIYLQAGNSYEFAVQFNIFLDCAAFGFSVVGGGMNSDNWFLSSDIRPVDPFFIDLVSQETVIIDDTVYYAIWTDPWYFEPGDNVELWATIWNAGTDDANGFHVQLGLDDIYCAQTQSPITLPAGELATFYTDPIQWPSDTEIHCVWCFADCYDDISEVVEDNNIGVHPHSAWGDPDLGIEDATLIQCNPWPPEWEEIDWQNADTFENGDRVSPVALITNNGDGPTGGEPDFTFHIELYMDDTLFAEGDASLGPGGSLIAYIEESGNPGFNWPDDSCHTFRWEVDDSVHGLHDELQETYCPEVSPANLVWNPTGYNFGNIAVGERSSNYGFILTNTGGTSTSGTVSITGDFHIDGDSSYNLNPNGGSKTFQVYFQPTGSGTRTGNLRASSANQPTASLSGNGVLLNPIIELSPGNHDFGDIVVDTCSLEFEFILKNIGTGTATGSVFLTGSNPVDFNITEGEGYFSLGTNEQKSIKVMFCPTAAVPRYATLYADGGNYNDDESSLSGTGVAPNPIIELTPDSHDFGEVIIGESSPEYPFTLTNVGTGTATGNVYQTGSNTDQFIITSGDGNFSLTAGESKPIKVKFSPTSAGSKSATLYADASNCEDDTSSLSGTGVELNPNFFVHPTDVYLSVKRTRTGTSSTTIYNNGNVDLYWGIRNISSEWTTGFTISPLYGGPLSPGGNVSVNIQVTAPWDLGLHEGQFTVYANGCRDVIVYVHLTVERLCFLAGTKITMADGTYKNIEDVKVGDMVLSYDEVTNKMIPAKVTNVDHHTTKDELANQYIMINNNLRVTPDHPLLINGKWMEAGKAKIGDSLLKADQKTVSPVSIRSLKIISQSVPTYNIQVDIYHTYIAGGVIVCDKRDNSNTVPIST